MLGFLETFFSVDKDEEQNIQSFSETPAKPTKAKDLTETEDEVQQIHKQTEDEDKEYREEHTPEDDDQQEDDLGDFGEDTASDTSEESSTDNTENNDEDNSEEESDDQMKDGSDEDDFSLQAMSEYEIRTTKIISKKALEYATSSGPDVVGGCAGCSKGNEDAADAAIIDAEITPAERTVPKGGGNGSDNGGGSDDFGSDDSGSSDDDFNFDDDFSLCYDKYIEAVNKMHMIAAQEDLLDMSIHNILETANNLVGLTARGVAATTRALVDDVLPAAFKVAKKAGEILANAFVYTKNVVSKIIANKTLLLRVWNTKIKLYLKVVSTEKLAKMKVQCFSKEDFLKIGKATINVHDTLTKNGDKVANAKLSDKIIVNLMKELASIGVEIDVTKDKIDLSKLYEKRKIGSIMDLGFTPDNIEECMLWCIDVSKRIPEEDNASPMLAGFAKVHGFFKSRNNAFQRNAANKKLSIEKRQEDIGIYVSSELKVKFGADASRIVYQIWNELIAQMLEVCEKYEKALIPGKVKDEKDDDRS